MTNPNLPDSENPTEQGGTSRRLLVGTAGLVAAAGVTAAVASPAGAWAAPAVKRVLGLPSAAASGASRALVRITFEGSQSASNAAGSIVTLPASVVFANVDATTTVTAGTRILVSLTYEGAVLVVDRAASAAAATLNGSVDPSLVAVSGGALILQKSVAAGSTVSIPPVVTVVPTVPPIGDGLAGASYTLTMTDDSPVQDRSASAVTTVTGTPSTPDYYEYAFRGTRQTAPSPTGAVYSYPAYLTVTKGPDEDPYNSGALYLDYSAHDFPFDLLAGTTRLNGKLDPQAGSASLGDRWTPEPFFTVRLPLAVGDVVEFPLYALEPRDVATTGTGALTLESSIDLGGSAPLVYASVSTTVLAQAPVTGLFDAALSFSGSVDNGITANLPETLDITAANANAVPAGIVITMAKGHNHTLGSIGTPTINGADRPGAVDVIRLASEQPSVLFVTSVAVPAGGTLSIPLDFDPDWADSTSMTATLSTTGRDQNAGNNTATRALTLD